jgi:hypothetical protein
LSTKSENNRKWWEANKERLRASRSEYQKQWYQRNKEAAKERAATQRRLNPAKAKENAWRCQQIDCTFDLFQKLYAEQQGLCAICGNPETAKDPRTGVVKSLAVDHCHKTGRVRGLLCHRCNKALGFFDDSIKVLQQSIVYLRKNDPQQDSTN